MQRNDATAATIAAQARVAASLPPEDDAFDLADRGFVATIEHAEIPGIWSQRPYAFITGEPPATVHPGLWRQAKLNGRHGLYQVVPGIWQVRGFDLSIVTFVRGQAGWIVIDPLTSADPPPPRSRCSSSTRATRRSPRSSTRTAMSTITAASPVCCLKAGARSTRPRDS